MDTDKRREQKRLAAERYRKANPEVVKQRNREQYEKNKEKRIAYAKEYYSNNLEKLTFASKQRYEKNKESIGESRKEYRQNHPEHFARLEKKYDLWSKYRLTLFDLQGMLNQQNGLCANDGCKTMLTTGKSGYCVDHDHKTGIVRGLLCRNCNLALGHAKDSLQRLQGLMDYLKVRNGT